MSETSKFNINDYLLALTDSGNEEDVLKEVGSNKSDIDYMDTDLEDDYDELEDIIEENVLRKRIKDLNSSGSESDDDDLFQMLGCVKKEPTKVVVEEYSDLIESAIQKNRHMKGILESLESILIIRSRQFDLIYLDNLEKVIDTPTPLRTPEGDFYLKFTSPYFRDGQFPCPANREQLIKAKLNKALYLHKDANESWSVDDMSHLEDAIRDLIISNYLKIKEREGKGKSLSKKTLFEYIFAGRNNSLNDVIEKFHVGLLDWDLVSNQMVNPHSARDCEVFWNVYLKPSINKSSWDASECLELTRIVKSNNFRNWHDIAEKLNTSRSGYLCFVQYHRYLEKPVVQWTKEELLILHKVVQACKVGGHINWSKVMFYSEGYDFNHIYYKYYKSFNSIGELPRKGRFDRSEDNFIVHAIKNEGLSLPMVTKLLPSRNTVQIRDRYNSLTNDGKTGSWTKDEDLKLIQLVEEHGRGNWAQVAKEMKNRTRVQVRQHYKHVQKMLHRNPNLTPETYRTRPIRTKKRPKKLSKNIEPHKAMKGIKNDKDETNIIKYFAHERKVLEMRQSISSTYETNKEEIMTMCKILGVEFPANFSGLSVDTKPWQEYIYEASKFVSRHASELHSNSNSKKEGTVTLIPPNLVVFNALRNIYTRLNEEKDDFSKVGNLELKNEDPLFNKTLENWYKRLLTIFGSSLSIQDKSAFQLQKQIKQNQSKK